MSKRKIITLVASLVIVIGVVVGGTLAYFSDSDVKTNTFTVGNVYIELTEPAWIEEGVNDAPEAYPGEALAKDPTVANIGANPCFVRVKVEGLDKLVPAELKGTDAAEPYMIRIRSNQHGVGQPNDNWVYKGGYFYYIGTGGELGAVLLGSADGSTPGVTSAAFNHIVIPTVITNGQPGVGIDVVVTAEAVQAQGAMGKFDHVKKMQLEPYIGTDGVNYKGIAEWFDDCGL